MVITRITKEIEQDFDLIWPARRPRLNEHGLYAYGAYKEIDATRVMASGVLLFELSSKGDNGELPADEKKKTDIKNRVAVSRMADYLGITDVFIKKSIVNNDNKLMERSENRNLLAEGYVSSDTVHELRKLSPNALKKLSSLQTME